MWSCWYVGTQLLLLGGKNFEEGARVGAYELFVLSYSIYRRDQVKSNVNKLKEKVERLESR